MQVQKRTRKRMIFHLFFSAKQDETIEFMRLLKAGHTFSLS